MWMNIADIVDPKKILDDDLNAPYHEINEPNEFAVWIKATELTMLGVGTGKLEPKSVSDFNSST
jgi:hypothetical protein